MQEKLIKTMVNIVFTMGDTGGYAIYEWYKLFPEDREKAIREYIYLKAYLLEKAAELTAKVISKEEWNEIYFSLGEVFTKEVVNYGCNYAEMCEALKYYQNTANTTNLVQLFCMRSGIGSTTYSQQLVKDVPEVLSRCQADLRKELRKI